jgi:guanosine-3',5'-bis(diphosphate) 3'-pyrophosphohydrolase
MMPPEPDTTLLLRALHFSAEKHRTQRRKDAEASPYINHPIAVARTLAVLHDTIEDTETTPEELEALFGAEVRALVEEVTDDKSLPKHERKSRQIEHAPGASTRAKQIKIADKICNVRDVTHNPPSKWSHERKREYLDWTSEVVRGCRGCNAAIERRYDEVLAEARAILGPQN